jgi:hypothetical protein
MPRPSQRPLCAILGFALLSVFVVVARLRLKPEPCPRARPENNAVMIRDVFMRFRMRYVSRCANTKPETKSRQAVACFKTLPVCPGPCYRARAARAPAAVRNL